MVSIAFGPATGFRHPLSREVEAGLTGAVAAALGVPLAFGLAYFFTVGPTEDQLHSTSPRNMLGHAEAKTSC